MLLEDHPESLDLSNHKDKTLCSSANEQLENEFNRLWEMWPAKKNKIASKKAFKAKNKNKTSKGVTAFVNMLINDVQTRLRANQYSFDKRNLEKHIKYELYNDEITNQNNESVSKLDAGQQASDAKSKELFG